MCYVCERQGHVGPHYRKTLTIIRAALKVWGRKRQGEQEEQATLDIPWESTCADWPIPNRVKVEWLSAPKVEKPWTEAYIAKRQREYARYTAMDFDVLPRVHRL